MKVTFRQSGGFAGLARGCELDTEHLPAEEAATLESLVEQSHLPQTLEAQSPQARDALSYLITIDSGGETRRAVLDDRTIPDCARPLVQFLQRHARPQPRR